MNEKIRIEHVIKKFKEYTVLDDVSLTFEEGKIHGIIGRNGSGKSVLFKCICGFMFPDSGKIFVNGKEIGKDIEIPEKTGALIESPGYLANYSGYRNLQFLASINGNVKKEEIKTILNLVGLGGAGHKRVGKYSMGMKQRYGIAQALMENPDLLILDEPMNGLDYKGVDDIRRILKALKEQGKTILLASHNKEDISVLCDTVVEIDRGKIL
jgi:ABC-2 type transport system ATP-binding protein